MAKRFTDTDKWKRTFFTNLNFRGKLAWIYLLDNCDHTGVWHINFSLMSFQVGFKVTSENLQEWFSDKIRFIEDDKIFIRSFIDFQYPDLNPNNNAHKAVLKILEKEPLMRSSLGPQVKDKVKVKVKEKEEAGPLLELSDEFINLNLGTCSQELQKKWLEFYKNADWIKAELKKASIHLESTGKKKNIPRFFSNWLSNALTRNPPAKAQQGFKFGDKYS